MANQTVYDRLSGDSKMQVLHGLGGIKGWIDSTIAECKSETGQAQKAAWALRKIIDEMENPIAIANLKALLSELDADSPAGEGNNPTIIGLGEE